ARARRRDRGPQRNGPGRRLHHLPSRRAHRESLFGARKTMTNKGRLDVIDDEVNAATALETLLREDGYEVAQANDARTGLQLIEKTDPDVVLSDLRMPGMDGLELLAKVKEMRADTMVVLMTAYGTVRTAVQAMKLGAEDYLGKPIDVEELEIVLQKT